MSYKSTEGKIEWDAGKNNLLDRMAVKLSEWAKNGQSPDIAGSDVAYALCLQKKRLEKKNLTTEIQLIPHETYMQDAGMWQDKKYTNNLKFHLCTRKQSYYKNGKPIHKMSQDATLYTINTTANYEDAAENDSYTYPSCGAVSTVKQLREECPYCNGKFMMSDLFPKVTNFYFLENIKLEKSQLKLYMLVCAVIGAVIGLINTKADAGFYFMILIGNMIATALVTVVAGYFLFAIMLLGYVVYKALASIPQLIKGGGTGRKVERYMKKYDELFSYKYFEGKVLSLLKMVLYSEDFKQLAVCEGTAINPAYADIVDVTYGGSIALKNFKVEGDYAHIELGVYLMNTYYKRNKISRKREVLKVGLCKNISRPSDFGFSIKAVKCPNCGGSFEATHEKNCPYCQGDYKLREHDWVVTFVK